MSNNTVSFHQLSEAQKREIRLSEGIGHEDYEREQSLRPEHAADAVSEALRIFNQHTEASAAVSEAEKIISEAQVKPLEGSIIFAVQEAINNTAHDFTQIQVQQVEIVQSLEIPKDVVISTDSIVKVDPKPQVEVKAPTAKDALGAAKETFGKIWNFFGKQSSEALSAWGDIIKQIRAEAPKPKDPKKEEAKAKQQAHNQQFNEGIVINTQNLRQEKVTMDQALRMRILEDVGAINISEDEANKLLKINTSFRGSLHAKGIVDLRDAIKYQQNLKKQASNTGLADTGHKAARGQMETKATQNNEHTGSNAQSAVG